MHTDKHGFGMEKGEVLANWIQLIIVLCQPTKRNLIPFPIRVYQCASVVNNSAVSCQEGTR